MTTPGSSIPVERFVGRASAFHARTVPDDGRARVWWFDPDRPAMVLGSRQPAELVDADACAALDAEVVRRRSGGGAVWLEPGGQAWVDVVVPVGHPRWIDDVRASMVWMGACWVEALGTSGIDADALEVHRDGLVGGTWSDLVCFAGLGPGEVRWRGRKLVGVSQRRGRWGARFQCSVHRIWHPEVFVPLFVGPTPDPAELAPVATLPDGVDLGALVGALAVAVGRPDPTDHRR